MVAKTKANDYQRSSGYESGGVAFVGCSLIGIVLGMLYGQIAVGSLLGVGVGFMIMALMRWSASQRNP